MLMPSYVEVPLPISSRIIRLFDVAFSRIDETSLISTINVDCPPARSSEAPIRVNMLSTTPIFALFAGTNEPICAIKAIRAVCLMYVDLPAMFGPVIMSVLFFEQSSRVSFGTNGAPSENFSTTGCRPPLIIISSELSTSGLS